MPSNPVVLTATGLSSTSGWVYWMPDVYGMSPFNIGIMCEVNSTGTQTYNIEHSFDYNGTWSSNFNGWNVSSTSGTAWLANTGITGATSNISGNYAFPVPVIRINVTAGSCIGTVTAKFFEAG